MRQNKSHLYRLSTCPKLFHFLTDPSTHLVLDTLIKMSLLFSSLRAAASRPSAAACRLPQQQPSSSAGRATTIITSTMTMIVRGVKTKVRIIAIKDLPNGKAYAKDVVKVAAGYARNYLIPQKFAVYATRQNFMKYELKDPELETIDERRLRLEQEALQTDNQDLKAYDILRHYLRNKTVGIRLCILFWDFASLLNSIY